MPMPALGEPMHRTIDSSEAPILETRSLGVRYGRSEALRNVSLAFRQGEITALIGASGSGKTSFLQTLNRLSDLIPSCQITGEILFQGEDCRGAGVDVLELRRRIGMIFQKPNPFPLSIRANIELALREHRTPKPRRRELVESSLRAAGLWAEVKDRLDASALFLSGGQQQRLCLARALALQPAVLLLDEPCSALDPGATAAVERQLLSLKGETTMVVVTHNLAQARRLADRAAYFAQVDGAGGLIEEGAADELLSSPRDPRTVAYLSQERG